MIETLKGPTERTVPGERSQWWLAAALRSMPDAIIVMDTNRHVVAVNAAAERMTGASPCLGHTLSDVLPFVDDRAGESIEAAIAKVLSSGEAVALEEHAVGRGDDGVERFVDGHAAPIQDGAKTIGVVLSFRDASRHRQERAEMSKQLGQLSDALRLQEQLVAILGHDLRNPLGSIVLSAQLLLRPGREASASAARRILHGGRRMSRMIEQLLDFSRMRSLGGIPVRRGPTNLGVIGRELLDTLTLGYERRALTVDFGGDLEGEWDTERLRSVVSTLLSNALEHGDRNGSIALRIDGNDEDTVVLSVTNSGEVPPSIYPELFDPVRSLRQPRRRAQGLGLGLYIGQGIVRSHGGTLTVDSTGGRTVVTVRLPRKCATRTPRA